MDELQAMPIAELLGGGANRRHVETISIERR